jgi:hypothetical protein
MAKDKNDEYITFLSFAALNFYLSDDESMVDLRSIIESVGFIGLFTASLSSHKYASFFHHLRGIGGKVSNTATFVAVGLDLYAAYSDRDPEKLLDASITALSFIPGIGALASVEVMYGKKAMKMMARGVAELDQTLKKDPISFFNAIFKYSSGGYSLRNVW